MGYMFGGMDWTKTFLGRAFKAQEQVLFFFASIIFIISVALHLFSIKELRYDPRQQKVQEDQDSQSSSSVELNPSLSCPRTQLDLISEEGDFQFFEDNQSEGEIQMDFLNVRSKSDSALAVPDTAIELDPDLDLDLDGYFLHNVDPASSRDFQYETSFKTRQNSALHLEVDPNNKDGFFASARVIAGDLTGSGNAAFLTVASNNHPNKPYLRPPNLPGRRRLPSFYRQPSFTFTYHGRTGLSRLRRRPIKSSRSLNDLDALAKRRHRRRTPRGVGRRSSSSSSSTETEDEESEDEGRGGTTVRLMWMSMLKMPPHLWRLCVCHLLTWFSIISQAVFYTDFMGQVIFEGDPMVWRAHLFIYFFIFVMIYRSITRNACLYLFIVFLLYTGC